MPIGLATRRLIVSSLYCSSAILFISHLLISGRLPNRLSKIGTDIDLLYLLIGVGFWILASFHGFYCKYQARKKIKKQITHRLAHAWHESTHAFINASFYASSAIFFIVADLHTFTLTSAVVIRLCGSCLWLSSSLLNMKLAVVLRHQQIKPDNKIIKLFGIDITIFYFLSELQYLLAGLLYAYTLWTVNIISLLMIASNNCWLLAGIHEVLRTYRQMQQRPSTFKVLISQKTIPVDASN